ncbi:TPA: replication protein, partial [Klebsiella pneumoniae]|nr:replication protein [Klebsiella pneumoniae]
MRKTYGFNKKVDWISNEQLSKLTGMLPHKCSAAKSALVKRKILCQNGRLTGINKAIGDWEKSLNPNQVNLPESGKESLPESGNSTYPNQVNT